MRFDVRPTTMKQKQGTLCFSLFVGWPHLVLTTMRVALYCDKKRTAVLWLPAGDMKWFICHAIL